MKVGHVSSRLSSEASGLTNAVISLVRTTIDIGVDSRLYVLQLPTNSLGSIPARVFPSLHFGARLGCSSMMSQALMADASDLDVIHVHSLWTMPGLYASHATRNTFCKLVISPHGTLAEWSLKWHRARKQLAWIFYQRSVLETADCIHATSESEWRDIRKTGVKVPVAVIPLGVDIPKCQIFQKISASRQVLYMSRIHPEKGVDVLLHAWKQLESKTHDWTLRIAGPEADDEYSAAMIEMSHDLGLNNVSFLGPLFGAEKISAYQEADVFVLPSHSENFGLVIAESLANGTPVITTKGTPWEGLVQHDCGWWINDNESCLIAALEQAMSFDQERLAEMGTRGRTWMENEFAWPAISRRMLLTYEWLLGQAERPEWVHLD